MEEEKPPLERFRESPEFGVFQLNEYIHAFRTSSDRARYVIFITTAVSLLMLIAAWNYHRWSWSRRAAELYFEHRQHVLDEEWMKMTRDERAQSAARARIDALLAKIEASPANANAAELRQAVLDADRVNRTTPLRDELARRWEFAEWTAREHDTEWYGGQAAEFYGRGIFVPVPGLGASIHVNDMALIGGLVLLTLTALLWVALIRQHENLYLTLFKIDALRRQEPDPSDGDSISNLLYHSLAMAQVLSHPPTLARWNLRQRHHFVYAFGAMSVYFAPALVHGAIVFQNILSRERAYVVWTREVANVRLGIQVLFTLGIFTFCLLAFIYARSCDRRWRKTFYAINRGLRRVEQRAWSEWVGLTDGNIPSRDLRRLARDLTYRLEVRAARPPEVREDRVAHRKRHTLDLRRHGLSLRGIWRCVVELFRRPGAGLVITQRELRKAVQDLFIHAVGPDADPRTTRLRRIRVDRNVLTLDRDQVKSWDVKITADVEYD